jgi:two-component system OmpR family response regulator
MLMKNKGKILLVEDDANLSFLIKDYLELLGYQTVVAPNGEVGLSAFQTQNFDLLIVDVVMPKKDGYTLVRELRQSDEDIPIIFLSVRSSKEDKIEGFKAGGDD